MDDALGSGTSAGMTTQQCFDFYKDRPYKQQVDQPTGFCSKCGRIPNQCKCDKTKEKNNGFKQRR